MLRPRKKARSFTLQVQVMEPARSIKDGVNTTQVVGLGNTSINYVG